MIDTIAVETDVAPCKHDQIHPVDKWFDGASFAGSLIRDCLDCKAANHMRQDLVWTDLVWETNTRTYGQWKFLTEWANYTNRAEHEVREMYDEALTQVLAWFTENGGVLAHLMGCSDIPETLAEAQETQLGHFVMDVMEWKFQWETWFHGQVEQCVADHLAEEWGADEVLAVTQELEARGVENPEPRGIDLYFPGVDRTVQVKTGKGGPVPCDADVVARYLDEDESPAGHGAEIQLYNPA